jgi:hypothetical protein
MTDRKLAVGRAYQWWTGRHGRPRRQERPGLPRKAKTTLPARETKAARAVETARVAGVTRAAETVRATLGAIKRAFRNDTFK